MVISIFVNDDKTEMAFDKNRLILVIMRMIVMKNQNFLSK